MKESRLTLRPADLADIDTFCDALWLEDGLAKATLDSYRTDLGRLAGWLAETQAEALRDARETTLTAFLAQLARQTRASSKTGPTPATSSRLSASSGEVRSQRSRASPGPR